MAASVALPFLICDYRGENMADWKGSNRASATQNSNVGYPAKAS